MVLQKHNRIQHLQALAKHLFGRITGYRHIKTKVMQNPSTHGESLRNPGLLLASAAALAGAAILHDYIKGGRENAELRTETELLTNPVIDAEHTVIWLVGCMQKGEEAFDNLMQIPEMEDTNLIVPCRPQVSQDGKLDQDAMCKKIVDQLIATEAKRVVIAADSRGALDAVDLTQYIDRNGLADVLGEFEIMLFNASPHDGQDITDSRKWLLRGAKALQHFSFANHIKPYFMQKAGHGSSAEATLSETVLAGRNIEQAPAVNPLPPVFKKLLYIRGQGPDPTVRTKEASEKYRQDTPVNRFEEHIDLLRKPGTHIGGRGRYRFLLELAEVLPSKVVEELPVEEVVLYFDHQPQAA